MAKDNKRDDQSDLWDKKRRHIKSKIKKGNESTEKYLDNVYGMRGNLDEVTSQANEDLEKMKVIESFFSEENTRIDLNPVLEGSIDILEDLSERYARRWSWLERQSNILRNRTDSFAAAASASGTMAPSMAVFTYPIIERIEPQRHRFQYTERLKAPTPFDRKNELIEKLSTIDRFLVSRLEGTWQTINDSSKADRVSQSATSIRELITTLLNRFAPREDVKRAWWFEQDPNNKGTVTRRKRIRYAIAGNNKDISEKELEVIIEAVDHSYEEFDKLNKLTHLQEYEEDLVSRVKSTFDQCQIHLLKLIELRELYFKI